MNQELKPKPRKKYPQKPRFGPQESDPTPRQRKYAANMVKSLSTNMTKKAMALDAGYGIGAAVTPKGKIENGKGFKKALAELLTPNIISEAQVVIKDGLRADKPVFLGKGGVVIHTDYTERRKHAELILDLAGLTGDDNEPRSSKGSTVNIAILPAKVQEIISE